MPQKSRSAGCTVNGRNRSSFFSSDLACSVCATFHRRNERGLGDGGREVESNVSRSWVMLIQETTSMAIGGERFSMTMALRGLIHLTGKVVPVSAYAGHRQ